MHPCRVRRGQLATCFRCRSWAGYTIKMKQMEKMPFAKDHHMVKTVPPD
jgi:hypothetical protein